MNKKDIVIISFFVLIFAVVLYERKLKHVFSGGTSSSKETASSTSGEKGNHASELNESFANIVEAITGSKDSKPQKGVPPAGLNTKSFYDEKGNFKSYYEGKVPDEFITKLEHFTDPHKMQDDIDYKSSKMFWHQDAEREEFKKFHDIRGKDKKKWNELLDNQARARFEAAEKNRETWKQLKRESYQYDSELR